MQRSGKVDAFAFLTFLAESCRVRRTSTPSAAREVPPQQRKACRAVPTSAGLRLTTRAGADHPPQQELRSSTSLPPRIREQISEFATVASTFRFRQRAMGLLPSAALLSHRSCVGELSTAPPGRGTGTTGVLPRLFSGWSRPQVSAIVQRRLRCSASWRAKG